MAGKHSRPEEWGHGIALILRELADFRAEAAEDRKQAAEDRKRAAEDRKQFLEYCKRAEDDRKEGAKTLKGIRDALVIIGSEGGKFRIEQERQGRILTEIRDALKGGGRGGQRPNGREGGERP